MLIAKWRVRPQWKATRSFASLWLLLLLLLRLLPGKYMKIVLTLDKRHKRHKVKRALGASSCLPSPSWLPSLLHLFCVCRDRRDNKFNELQSKTVEKLAATWRPLGNPNYFFPFTIRTAARVGDHMTDLSQIWRGTMDSVAFFVCVHRWDKLCRSSLSPTRSDKLSLNCKIGGIGLYNRKRISQQQRTFSVANNDNWVSSSTSRMRTMGCPGSVSGQLTGCGVHTPSIFLSFFFFSFSPSLSCFFIA